MLEVINGKIMETPVASATMVHTGGACGSIYNDTGGAGCSTTGAGGGGFMPTGQITFAGASSGYWPYSTFWHSYPVYLCSDKTKKAIEVLKALQAEKILKCDSVPRFIELVEKISNLL